MSKVQDIITHLNGIKALLGKVSLKSIEDSNTHIKAIEAYISLLEPNYKQLPEFTLFKKTLVNLHTSIDTFKTILTRVYAKKGERDKLVREQKENVNNLIDNLLQLKFKRVRTTRKGGARLKKAKTRKLTKLSKGL